MNDGDAFLCNFWRAVSADPEAVAHHADWPVNDWALANGDDPKLRIALCGYEGAHDIPATWECVEWKSAGYGRTARGRKNAGRERIWFSPHCLQANVPNLFSHSGGTHAT